MNRALRESCVVTTPSMTESSSSDEGVIALQDDSYDETLVDLSDFDQITFTQVDEDGRTHTVILSAQHVAQLLPHMDQWKTNQHPPISLVRSPLN